MTAFGPPSTPDENRPAPTAEPTAAPGARPGDGPPPGPGAAAGPAAIPGPGTGYPPAGGGWYYAPPPPPKPGVVPLRPLGFGDVLTGAFDTVKRYRTVLSGYLARIVGLGVLTLALLTAVGTVMARRGAFDGFAAGFWFSATVDGGAFSATAADSPAFGTSFLALAALVLPAALVMVLLATALQAAAIVVTSYAVLGLPLTVEELRGRVRERFGALFLTRLLTALLVGGATAVCWLLLGLVGLGLLGAGAPRSFFIVAPPLSLLAVVAVGCYLVIRWGFGPTACVLEGKPPVAALRRSSELVRGSWWRAFGYSALVSIILSTLDQMIQMVLIIPALVVAFAIWSSGDPSATRMFLAVTVVGVAMLLPPVATLPISHMATTLLYTDHRFRGEGLHEQLAADARG
ncbi:DUF7847 domain-containing protein [Streptomyces alkaliterrae]|uniref:DUF7847 domain-containing protein n=1 Tax=Streptomyces alkaliterrae TaxID=2213162 RepID=A0A5P0YS39_9ACTN|nr:hypothetical protein [Streptomyces alkaliterrae]MBB1260830.1 hypothetical protein [Streptomyces alkaliterrae]MQS02417.1 hypothetical protein [Streptomyces alkaliterrae]